MSIWSTGFLVFRKTLPPGRAIAFSLVIHFLFVFLVRSYRFLEHALTALLAGNSVGFWWWVSVSWAATIFTLALPYLFVRGVPGPNLRSGARIETVPALFFVVSSLLFTPVHIH
jgi:hypothetical protein